MDNNYFTMRICEAVIHVGEILVALSIANIMFGS